MIGTSREVESFLQNLAMMMEAGLHLVDALRTLEQEIRRRVVQRMVQDVRERVEGGSPLWRSLDAQGTFSAYALSLIRIGEESGNLAKNLTHLAAQQEKDHALRQKIQMAMLYPTIVIIVTIAIVAGLSIFVLPNLIGILYSLNVPLPLLTRIVIAVTEFSQVHGALVFPGVIMGFLTLLLLFKHTPLRSVGHRLLLAIPGVGRLIREATISHFGMILGSLLQAGVPPLEALSSLIHVTTIVHYRRFYESLTERISQGCSFARSFEMIPQSSAILPPSVQQMVVTGERSGQLAHVLLAISDRYEKRAEETAQKLPVILEPLLLLFVGALVGAIALAILLPIYSIVGTVGR